MAQFGDKDPYQQKPLERREIIETSHKAAIKMAEMLGQDVNYNAVGAQRGQHAAIPLPKEEGSSLQQIKFFLPNRETPATDTEALNEDQDSRRYFDEQEDNKKVRFDNPLQLDISKGTELEGEEQEQLITDILERRLAYLYLAFQPPEPIEGPADTLFVVKKSKDNEERVFIRAHSLVLKRTNDAFNELIGYRPPMVPTPSNDEEAEKTEMQISWKQEDKYGPSRMSMYSNLIKEVEKEREYKYLEAVREHQGGESTQEPQEKKKTLTNKHSTVSFEAINIISDTGEAIPPAETTLSNIKNNDHENEFNSADKFDREENPRLSTTLRTKHGRESLNRTLSSKTFQNSKRMSLDLENVIGNLDESAKPSIVKELLDASFKLVQLPGSEHLPEGLKQSFEQFVNSINNFKNPDLDGLKQQELTETEVDGKSLESTFLGMVGRSSQDMLNILSNISQGIVERRKSKILLDEARRKELEGVPGNNVSATVARTTLERRKSQSYLENQQRRASMGPLERRTSWALITNGDKRISPSFLERRQSKALVEITKRNSKTLNEEEINLRRRNSKAAVAAFERRKRLSALEDKRTQELGYNSGPYDGGLSGIIEMSGPALQAQLRAPGTRPTIVTNLMQRKSSSKGEHFQERRLSNPPQLSHTRDEDKDEVIKFFEDEDAHGYSSSESSIEKSQPRLIPGNVEFVIERPHWTIDILCAIMEFIYTESLHIHCQELPDVYRAANEILLSSLTDVIRLKPINQYFRLAMEDDDNREALLDLAKELTTSADYQNYVNKNEEFVNLKTLCEAFNLKGPLEKKPYTLLLETGHVAFKNLPFVTPGFHTIGGEMVLILKDPREGTRLYEQNMEQNEYLTFRKKISDRKNEPPFKKMNWLGKWPNIEKTRNRDKAWKIYLFHFPNLSRDIPLKNYIFYKHIASLTLRPSGKEEFSLRIICGILICPVLFKALQLSFPELDIIAGRGAGYYLGGETHGNNITLTGNPLYLVRACKSIPRHLVGRSVLRVSCPTERTFIRLWKSTNRFGVDLECNVLYFLKPLIQIQKMLEYWHGLDMNADYVVTHPREMVELVEPHDPF